LTVKETGVSEIKHNTDIAEIKTISSYVCPTTPITALLHS